MKTCHDIKATTDHDSFICGFMDPIHNTTHPLTWTHVIGQPAVVQNYQFMSYIDPNEYPTLCTLISTTVTMSDWTANPHSDTTLDDKIANDAKELTFLPYNPSRIRTMNELAFFTDAAYQNGVAMTVKTKSYTEWVCNFYWWSNTLCK